MIIKLLIVLLISLVFEASGVIFLSRGLKEIGAVNAINPSQVIQLIKRGSTNANILLGIAQEALFFLALLYLMSQAEVSFVWPLTSLGFVFTTVAAKWFLHEQIPLSRWIGVVFIVLGAMLITHSEHAETKPAGAKPDLRQR